MFHGKTSQTPLSRSPLAHKNTKGNLLEVDICIPDVYIQPNESHPIQSSVVWQYLQVEKDKCSVGNDALICFQYSIY